MRGTLAGRCYEEDTYTGVVSCYSRKRTHVCVEGIRDSRGDEVAGHVWFISRPFRRVEARQGDHVRFRARIVPYEKESGEDYKLSYPRHLKVLPRRQ